MPTVCVGVSPEVRAEVLQTVALQYDRTRASVGVKLFRNVHRIQMHLECNHANIPAHTFYCIRSRVAKMGASFQRTRQLMGWSQSFDLEVFFHTLFMLVLSVAKWKVV